MTDDAGQLWRAFAGRYGGRVPETPADALDILERSGATRAEIAQWKKDVARELGVTVRQVQRMTTRTGRERRGTARHADALRRLAAQSPAVRKAAQSPRRAARQANRGARLKIKGWQGPSIGGKDYKRERTIERYIDGDTLAEARAAWEAGDDQQAAAVLSQALEDHGYPAWEWDSEAVIELLAEHRE